MQGKTHAYAGAIVGIAFASSVFKEKTHLLYESAIIIGSLWGSRFPDIDVKDSAAYNGSILSHFIYSMLIDASDGLLTHEHDVIGHRGITHSMLTIFPFSMLAVFLCLLFKFCHFPGITTILFFTLGIYMGILSHIILDCANSKGVKIFAPVSDRSFSYAHLKNGGLGEKIICTILGFALFFSIVLWLGRIMVGWGR